VTSYLVVRLVHQTICTLESLHLGASDVEESMSPVSRAPLLEIWIDVRRTIDLGWAKLRPQIRSKYQMLQPLQTSSFENVQVLLLWCNAA
jgi:hypothetical protein